MQAVFPLWRQETVELAQRFIERGFKAYLSCVEPVLGTSFAGRAFDRSLIADLPPEVDPCGENGEYHTYVWDGPIFGHPVEVSVGEIVKRDGRHYADLLPHGTEATTTALQSSIPFVGQI
jgi:diphthamide synthase (EF-2-diphthine--ammonia ligase)